MSTQKKSKRAIKQNANTQTKEQMLKEASMQEDALKHLVTWRAAAIIAAAFGLVVSYCGFTRTYLPFAMGIVGCVAAILAAAFALLVNRAIRHGRKNVAIIRRLTESKAADDSNQQAVLLEPCCKDYLWGGEKLKTEYHISSPLKPLAEAWVLADHPDGQSKIASGTFRGLSFSEYLKKTGKSQLGSLCKTEECPILIKWIDSLQPLSVQVHPDDAYAQREENSLGKTEMWYILGADPNAYLYFGFSKDLTKEEFQSRIEEDTLLEVLNKVAVHPGDVFFIEAGTIHAIGPGITLCEVQQNSNVTYRVYDYGRTDADGNPRPLHIQRALDVTNLHKTDLPQPGTKPSKSEQKLACCPYFTVTHLPITKPHTLTVTPSSFLSLVVVEGEVTLQQQAHSLPLKKGSSAFLPAGSGTYKIFGNGRCICTTLD